MTAACPRRVDGSIGVCPPGARAFPLDDRVTAQQVWDEYIKAVGGPGALAKLTSVTAKGICAGFDTGFEKVPVEVYGRAPASIDSTQRRRNPVYAKRQSR